MWDYNLHDQVRLHHHLIHHLLSCKTYTKPEILFCFIVIIYHCLTHFSDNWIVFSFRTNFSLSSNKSINLLTEVESWNLSSLSISSGICFISELCFFWWSTWIRWEADWECSEGLDWVGWCAVLSFRDCCYTNRTLNKTCTQNWTYGTGR